MNIYKIREISRDGQCNVPLNNDISKCYHQIVDNLLHNLLITMTMKYTEQDMDKAYDKGIMDGKALNATNLLIALDALEYVDKRVHMHPVHCAISKIKKILEPDY
jgi:hypothetical protein